jgi:DNA-binding IclR family transcriptional regulator
VTDESPARRRPNQPAQRRNQSVHKAAAILRAAAENPEGETVSELARRAGLPRSTALRMVEGLVAERPPRRRSGDRVVLGAGLFALARLGDPDAALLEACEAPLAELAARVRETVTLTVARVDAGVSIVRQLDGPHIVGATNWVGKAFPIHASSSGKLALAHGGATARRGLPPSLPRHASRTITDRADLEAELDRIREQGWSEIVDELEDGLAAISVPVHDDGVFVGSVNVNGPTTRFDEEARRAALVATRETAAEIERLLDDRP